MLLTLLQSGGTPINHLPIAAADTYAATENLALVVPVLTGVLANDTGLEDGGLVLTVIGAVTGGGVVLNDDGSFTFTPTPAFTGAASFTYRVTDANGDFSEALVTINVAPAVVVVVPPPVTPPINAGRNRVIRRDGHMLPPPSRSAHLKRMRRRQQQQDDREVLAMLDSFLEVLD